MLSKRYESTEVYRRTWLIVKIISIPDEELSSIEAVYCYVFGRRMMAVARYYDLSCYMTRSSTSTENLKRKATAIKLKFK